MVKRRISTSGILRGGCRTSARSNSSSRRRGKAQEGARRLFVAYTRQACGVKGKWPLLADEVFNCGKVAELEFGSSRIKYLTFPRKVLPKLLDVTDERRALD
jgi:hypothetical protein